MRTRPIHLAAALVCALAASAVVAPPGASAGGLTTGFLDPEESASQQPALMVPGAIAVARVADAGAKIVRLYLYWNRVEQSDPLNPDDPNDPAYDWSIVDGQVRRAVEGGLRPMLDFRSAPMWAQGAAGANARGTYDPDPVRLTHFAIAAATRYNGDFTTADGALPAVRLWEIWNEPNLSSFLAPQFDADGHSAAPYIYRALVNAAGGAAHAVNAADIVIVGGTTSSGNHRPLDFLRKLLCLTADRPPKAACSATLEADVFTMHPYTPGSPSLRASNRDDIYLADLPRWAQLVRGAVEIGHVVDHFGVPKTSLPLWASEIGWDTNPPDPIAVPTRLHARWTVEALYRIWKTGLRVAIWNQLRDYPVTSDPMWGSYQGGLFTYGQPGEGDEARKPSFYAFRFPFVAYARAGHLSIWGRTPSGVGGRVVIERRTRSGWRAQFSLATSASGIFRRRWLSSRTTGYYRARLAGTSLRSVAFSLVRPPEMHVRVFGCGGLVACN